MIWPILLILGFWFFDLGADFHAAEMLVNVDLEEPSWWVLVTDDMVPSTVEEWSGIDDESYIIVSEEHVVEGVANFMARCILSNPKAEVNNFLFFSSDLTMCDVSCIDLLFLELQTLTPEELQKSMLWDFWFDLLNEYMLVHHFFLGL